MYKHNDNMDYNKASLFTVTMFLSIYYTGYQFPNGNLKPNIISDPILYVKFHYTTVQLFDI